MIMNIHWSQHTAAGTGILALLSAGSIWQSIVVGTAVYCVTNVIRLSITYLMGKLK